MNLLIGPMSTYVSEVLISIHHDDHDHDYQRGFANKDAGAGNMPEFDDILNVHNLEFGMIPLNLLGFRLHAIL